MAEFAANQITNARMAKKQQMRRTPQGAHLLLQLRTRVLNGRPRRRLQPLVPPDQPATGAPVGVPQSDAACDQGLCRSSSGRD
jgi:hypothetical protein